MTSHQLEEPLSKLIQKGMPLILKDYKERLSNCQMKSLTLKRAQEKVRLEGVSLDFLIRNIPPQTTFTSQEHNNSRLRHG